MKDLSFPIFLLISCVVCLTSCKTPERSQTDLIDPRSTDPTSVSSSQLTPRGPELSTGSQTMSVGPEPGTWLPRRGQEMMVAGQLVHVGSPIVLWLDPGGYDAYRVEKRFTPISESSWESIQDSDSSFASPNRYGMRQEGLTSEELERFRGGGWDTASLQDQVDQFVLHFDACGTSRRCFQVLHDLRCLSVHFMLDQDGTLYQTLDLKERAWHATTSNSRSVGVEIANIGAFPVEQESKLESWYQKDQSGKVEFVVPTWMQPSGYRTEGYHAFSSRNERVRGEIQGRDLVQYDLTDAQYEALIRLTAALCRVFPKMECDFPKDEQGRLITEKLNDTRLENYSGILGHYHIQSNKIDPGPAFDWDRLIRGTRQLLDPSKGK